MEFSTNLFLLRIISWKVSFMFFFSVIIHLVIWKVYGFIEQIIKCNKKNMQTEKMVTRTEPLEEPKFAFSHNVNVKYQRNMCELASKVNKKLISYLFNMIRMILYTHARKMWISLFVNHLSINWAVFIESINFWVISRSS